MKPILLATDGSTTAVKATQTAIHLAKLLDSELIVVTAWDIPYATVGLAPAPVTADSSKLSEDAARKVAADAAARAEEEGVETRSLVLRGFPVEEICSAAEKNDPRFLVIGSHGWNVFKRALFGSVSTGVLHRARCPVLVVRGDETATANGKRTQETAHA